MGYLKKTAQTSPPQGLFYHFCSATEKKQTFSQSERSYYCQLRSDWLVFIFWLRNGSGKIIIGEGWFVTSFDRHINIFIPLVINNVRKVPKKNIFGKRFLGTS